MKRNQIKLESNYRNEIFNCTNDHKTENKSPNQIKLLLCDEMMYKMSILLLKIHNYYL